MFEQVLENIQVKEVGNVKHYDENKFGFIIVNDSEFVHKHKAIIALVCTGTFPPSKREIPIIVVDYHFKHLSPLAKEIVVLHELGHKVDEIQNGFRKGKRSIKEELRADNFIKEFYPNYMIKEAMEEIFMVQYNVLGHLSECQKKEIIARLKNMEG